MTHHQNVNYEKEFEAYLNNEKHLDLMVLNRAKKFGDSKIAVRHKAYWQREAFTWKQFGDLIESAGQGLLSFGLKEFEFVGIFSNITHQKHLKRLLFLTGIYKLTRVMLFDDFIDMGKKSSLDAKLQERLTTK